MVEMSSLNIDLSLTPAEQTDTQLTLSSSEEPHTKVKGRNVPIQTNFGLNWNPQRTNKRGESDHATTPIGPMPEIVLQLRRTAYDCKRNTDTNKPMKLNLGSTIYNEYPLVAGYTLDPAST